MSGGDVQTDGGDVGVSKLSSEQRVAEWKCLVRLCSGVHGDDRRGVRGVRRREVQERERVGGVRGLRGDEALAGGGAERDGLRVQRRIHAARERGLDIRRGVRTGVCGMRSGQVQGVGRRSGVHYLCTGPVVRHRNDSVLLRVRVHRSRRRVVCRMRTGEVQELARLAGVHDVSSRLV